MDSTRSTPARASRSRYFSALGLVIGLGLTAGEAWATILLCTSNTAAQGDAVTPFPATNLDLDTAAGAQIVKSFSTATANQLVRVIFNAEGTIGGAATNWLDDTIFIDPAGTPAPFPCTPSDSDNALVSGNGTATQNDGWVSAVTQCYARIPTAGVHTVRVLVTPVPGAAWRIDDVSLCIDTQ